MAASAHPSWSFDVVVLHGSEVPAGAVDYARLRLAPLARRVKEPILLARVKLAIASDPARTLPALAEGTLDVNGDVVRAHVAAHEITEAIDLLERRLADKLEHRATHRLAKRHPHGGPA